MKKGLKALLIVLAVIAVLVIAGAVAIPRLIAGIEKKLETVVQIEIADIDLSTVPDGTYQGSYEAMPVAAEVEVTVKDHSITAIELVKHSHGRGSAAEVIPDRVVAAQSLQVDAVSGATHSSKVILLAIEDALKSAK